MFGFAKQAGVNAVGALLKKGGVPAAAAATVATAAVAQAEPLASAIIDKVGKKVTLKPVTAKLPNPVVDDAGNIVWFEDPEFPPDQNSLGDLKVKVYSWRRVEEIFADSGEEVKVFAGAIEPNDIVQGSIGNCWFLASLAALAEHPEVIKRVFRYPRYEDDEPALSPDGRYTFKFFDIETKQYVHLDIDDRIPCGANGQPIFARGRPGEAWVMLLEKAMAKYCGSYKLMVGGWSAWAFRTFTGYACAGFMNWKGGWVPVRPSTKTTSVQFGRPFRERKLLLDPRDKYLEWTLVNRLVNWLHDDDYDYVFSAGTKGSGDDTENVKGLYKSHAYSVLEIVPVSDGLTLIQLRNPHGKGEWSGDWCDGDAKWDEHPEALAAVQAATGARTNGNDGAFWMHFETDFVQYFYRVDAVRFPEAGKDKDGDGLEDDDVYGSSDEPFDEYGDLDLDEVLPATNEEEVQAQFAKVDLDGDGIVTRDELRTYLKTLDDKRLTPEVVTQLLDEIDIDKKAEGISYKEFRGCYGVL